MNSTSQLRVLHVLDNLRLGGTQALALRLMRQLTERGVEIELCVLGSDDRTHDWEWLPDRISWLKFAGDYRKPGSLKGCARQLRGIIGERKPGLVHSYLWVSDVTSAMASGNLPHIAHIVDRRSWQESTRLKHRYRKWLTRRAFSKADTRFFAVSEAARGFAIENLGLNPSSVRVAYNSIDPANFDETPCGFLAGDRNHPVLGIASRLEAEKGHSVLLEALSILQSRGIELPLKITGHGPIEESLKQQASTLSLKQVEFVGWVESIRAFLDEIDAFLVPSIDSEGLPTTILESMAANRLVIASDIGGATEAIRDGREGIIVPANQPAALADGIERLMTGTDKAKLMVANARQRVEAEFSIQKMVDVVEAGYRAMQNQRWETSF